MTQLSQSATMFPATVLLLFLHLSLTMSVQSSTHPSDIAALKAFKASIKPTTIPSYSCLGSWNFTSDPCSDTKVTHFICGVLCTPAGVTPPRVTQITLDPAGYSGTLSPLISKLTQLAVLDLSDNSFSGEIPSSLSSLYNLRTISLRQNSFSGSIPNSIGALKSLESLDLSRNSLSGWLPNSLNSLTNLRRVDISFNRLTGSLPKLPPNLLVLAAKANSLSGSFSKPTFQELNQLEVIELSDNRLSGTIQGWFLLLPSLQQVDLANNSFTGVEIWKPTSPDGGIIAVDLGFNRLSGYIPENFSVYPQLSSLSLRYNRLRGPIPRGLSKKPSLRRLYLDGNFLNGYPPDGLFAGGTLVSGSIGDNCLESCPVSSELCVKSQKSSLVCRQAYGGAPRS